jgi:NADH-quinone oxidoreductase subunit M
MVELYTELTTQFNLLAIVTLIPLVGGLFCFLFPMQFREDSLRAFALLTSLLSFVASLLLWVGFDESSSDFQYIYSLEGLKNFNISVSFGVDGISLFFILLTTLLVPLCILGSWEKPTTRLREYFGAFLIMEAFILIVFSVLDLLVFYVFFEAVLIPMFMIIGIFGSRERKVRAAYFFFLYTLLGSVFMLLALAVLYFETGTTDYQILVANPIAENKQYLLWLGFFASFAVKVPMMPVHIWLPEAHVEAPTAGSVILAGVLLKLGSYGMIRFSLPLFPLGSVYFKPLVYALAILAIVYTSLTAIRQSDMKRVIAYASVAHMNMTLVGLFSETAQGIEGSILQMLAHGLVSAALFFCIGVIYDRHHSRIISYYGGLSLTMPIYAALFLFFSLANIGFPGTANFVGEFLILLGTFQTNSFACFMSATSLILGGAYSLWLYNRLVYGNFKTQFVKFSEDLSRREFMVFLPLTILTLWIGVYPGFILNPLHVSSAHLLQQLAVFQV